MVKMHREILESKLGHALPDGHDPDHKNLNKLDNRRDNLRLATQSQNSMNFSYKPKSGFYGVFPRPSGKFMAIGKINSKNRSFGTFPTKEEAARKYDREMSQLVGGEFVRYNFPSNT